MSSFFPNAVGAKPHLQRRGGFTILYAAVIVGAVIMIGATITGIYQREAQLITSSEASSRAFYAADAALECAMYHDRQANTFQSGASQLSCAGDTVSITNPGGQPDYGFTLDDTAGANVCARVLIYKSPDGQGGTDTRIEARGRNTCQTSERQAERALRTAY